jgi:hypothetical protein
MGYSTDQVVRPSYTVASEWLAAHPSTADNSPTVYYPAFHRKVWARPVHRRGRKDDELPQSGKNWAKKMAIFAEETQSAP